MWPWGHLAVGYLVYSLVSHARHQRRPEEVPTVALAVGTQFPDLVDKPLAWSFGLLPNGRSLAHSLVVALLVVVALRVLLGRRGDGRVAAAFSLGYLSHLFADALYPALAGEHYLLGFLAWPLVPPVEYATDPSFLAHLQRLSLTPLVAFELALGGTAFLLWLADGAPGLGVVAAIPRWVGRKLSA